MPKCGKENIIRGEPNFKKRRIKVMKRFSLGIGGFLLISFAVFGCRTPEMVQVKMDYTPTNLVLPPKSFPQTPIFIGPFEDKRKTPDQIGENIEKPQAVPIKAEPAEIAAFMEKAFKKEFKKVGLNLVESGTEADRILHVSVLNLWVQEKSTYQSSLVAKVAVLDKSGKELFKEIFRVVGQRWGSSYHEDNYRKVISDNVVELLKNIFNNEAFMKTLA
jgi:hypothetical protein